MKRFENKVAFISGAASGIGRATAIRLASEGASVMLADISADGLNETRAQLPVDTHVDQVLCDVSDAAACDGAIAATLSTFGRLDVLCNIAGFGFLHNFQDFTDDQWQKMWGVNVSGVMYLCRAAMPALLESGGNIVNMSSSAGVVGQAYNTMYCATKGAVLLFTKALAAEFAGKGVRVNALCPGGVDTPLARKFQIPEGANPELLGRLNSLVDWAKPEEIAAAIAYIASDEARFVVGEGLSIDGGQTMV